MYHGGSTPKGEFFFNDEAYGYPKISYDFQAPIGEYGQLRPSFHYLKLIHFFLNDFGDLLAPMAVVLPKGSEKITPENTKDLRYSVRVKDGSGFVFLNNFQDDTVMTDKKNIQIRLKTARGTLLLPESRGFELKNEENAIFPFNFNLNGTLLNYATAQLLMKGDDPNNPYYIFFKPEGIEAEFSFMAKKGNIFIQNIIGSNTVKNSKRLLVKCSDKMSEFIIHNNGVKTKVLVVDKSVALKSYVVIINNKKYWVYSDALVLQGNSKLNILNEEKNDYELNIFPEISRVPKVDRGNIEKINNSVLFSSYKITLPKVTLRVMIQQVGDKRLLLTLPAAKPEGLNDIFLNIDYIGDTGQGFLNGELVTDEFYKGIPWKIGLKRFIGKASKEMLFYFRPLYKNAPFLVDLNLSGLPDFNVTPKITKIKGNSLIPEYLSTIEF
jgi:hypothetical protein